MFKARNIKQVREILDEYLQGSNTYTFVNSFTVKDFKGNSYEIVTAERNSIKGRIRLFDTDHKPHELSHLSIQSVSEGINNNNTILERAEYNKEYALNKALLNRILNGHSIEFYIRELNSPYKYRGKTFKEYAKEGYENGNLKSLKYYIIIVKMIIRLYEAKRQFANCTPDHTASAEFKGYYYHVLYMLKGNYKYELASRMWKEASHSDHVDDPYPIWNCYHTTCKKLLNIVEFFDYFIIKDEGYGFETINWLLLRGFIISPAVESSGKLLVEVPHELKLKVKKIREVL